MVKHESVTQKTRKCDSKHESVTHIIYAPSPGGCAHV